MQLDIRNRRKAMGMTQAKLSEKLGCSAITVCQWEIGTRTPGIETLVKLADIFGCTVDDLIIKN